MPYPLQTLSQFINFHELNVEVIDMQCSLMVSSDGLHDSVENKWNLIERIWEVVKKSFPLNSKREMEVKKSFEWHEKSVSGQQAKLSYMSYLPN